MITWQCISGGKTGKTTINLSNREKLRRKPLRRRCNRATSFRFLYSSSSYSRFVKRTDLTSLFGGAVDDGVFFVNTRARIHERTLIPWQAFACRADITICLGFHLKSVRLNCPAFAWFLPQTGICGCTCCSPTNQPNINAVL